MTPWLTVVGIGEDGIDGLSAIARAALDDAEILVGGERHLAMIADDDRPRITWGRPLSSTIEQIQDQRGHAVTVLATGDPMWYGIGATLCRNIEPAELRIIPAPSAFSLAAGRLGWPLADAECLTIHGRAIERVRYFLAPDAKLIILSNNGNSPADICKILCDTGYEDSRVNVLTHMSGPLEEIITASAKDWDNFDVADLNTIAVQCIAGPETKLFSHTPGLPDEAFHHDGQLTKREIRSATLAALSPLPGQLLWDVGAGCGSIAIEWMRSSPRVRAIALERNEERLAMIRDNALTLGVPDLEVVEGSAPDALNDFDPPDAIFIGGGLSAEGLIETCWSALKPGGRLVANSVTLEGEQKLIKWVEKNGGELVRCEISRSKKVGKFTGWEPMKPVTQLRATKDD